MSGLPGPPEILADLDRRLIFAGEDLVAVDKPPGIPSTGLALDDPRCLQFWLMRRFDRMVWAVHQLDADTSGVNLFTLSRRQVARQKARMEAPTGVKTYLAICHGEPAFDTIEVDQPIGFLDPEKTRLGIVDSGRKARSRFQVRARHNGYSALEVRIFNGRTHQIRIHLAHLSHPLVGECWYRSEPCTRWPRQALHAASLRFLDGANPREFRAPLAEDLRKLSAELGFRGNWQRS